MSQQHIETKKKRGIATILKVVWIWFVAFMFIWAGLSDKTALWIILPIVWLVWALRVSSRVISWAWKATTGKIIGSIVLGLLGFAMRNQEVNNPTPSSVASTTTNSWQATQTPTLTTWEIEAQRLAEEQKHKDALLQDQKSNPENYIEVVKNDWALDWFWTVATHTITLKNTSAIDYKDITLKAVYFSNSDTELDSTRKTIYEILPAGTTKTFKDVNFWFVHSQSSKSKVSVTSASLKE